MHKNCLKETSPPSNSSSPMTSNKMIVHLLWKSQIFCGSPFDSRESFQVDTYKTHHKPANRPSWRRIEEKKQYQPNVPQNHYYLQNILHYNNNNRLKFRLLEHIQWFYEQIPVSVPLHTWRILPRDFLSLFRPRSSDTSSYCSLELMEFPQEASLINLNTLSTYHNRHRHSLALVWHPASGADIFQYFYIIHSLLPQSEPAMMAAIGRPQHHRLL